MASLQEKIRVNSARGTSNQMTDYGNPRDYDIDEREEQRDRIAARVQRLRKAFETCCQCGQTNRAFELAEDLAYWSNKLLRLKS